MAFFLAYGECVECGKVELYLIEANSLKEAKEKYANADESIRCFPSPNDTMQFFLFDKKISQRLPTLKEFWELEGTVEE